MDHEICTLIGGGYDNTNPNLNFLIDFHPRSKILVEWVCQPDDPMAGLVCGVGCECNSTQTWQVPNLLACQALDICTCHLLLNSSELMFEVCCALYSNYPSSIIAVEFQNFLSRDGCHLTRTSRVSWQFRIYRFLAVQSASHFCQTVFLPTIMKLRRGSLGQQKWYH